MTPTKSLRKQLVLGLIAANLVVVALCVFSLFQSLQQFEMRAESLTQNIASAVDQSISGSIEKIDLALLSVVDELERQLASGKLDESSMTEFIGKHEKRLPEIEAFRVANAEGLVVLGKGLVKAEKVTWSDRNYFIYHRDNPQGTMHFVKPRMGRVAKQYIVNFSRRYNYPDGSFAGVVSAPIAVSYFTEMLARFSLGEHGTIVLRDEERGLITRLPALPDQPSGQIGDKSISPELQRLLDSKAPRNTYHTPSGADGYQRIVTYQRLSNAPIIVIAATAKKDYLAGWMSDVYKNVALGAGFILLSVVAGVLLSRQLVAAEIREKLLHDALSSGERQRESLRRLSEVSALAHLPLAEQLQQALAIGTRLLNLEFGIVSKIHADIYRIVSQVSPPNTLSNDQEFSFGVTYCNITLERGEVVSIANMGESIYAHHPCYSAFKLEAYIGAPIVVDGRMYGTVNFSSPNPYGREFDSTDCEFISLLAGWVGAVIARDSAQQNLAESKRNLQSIIETEPECVKVLGPGGVLLQMNRAGLAMIEADAPEQVIGKDVLGIISPQYRSAFMDLTRKVFEGESGSLEFEIVGLKGGHRWLDTHAVPMLENDGRIKALLGVTRDVTARKQAEAELERYQKQLEELVAERTAALMETEARASHILQSSADGLYGVDTKGAITFINPAACRMLGYTEEQVIGSNGHHLFHHSKPDGSPYPIEECPSHSALRLGETVRVDNEVYWHADGHPVPVMYAIHPMLQDGKTVGAVISFVNVSEQRAAAQARERALLAAENLAKVRSEFLANMSHEIRTPLNGVLGYADIGYRHYQNSEKARDAFAKIKVSGQRLLGVINDVLDFSKIEAGKLNIEQIPVDLSEVIDHSVELVRQKAEAKQLSLEVRLAKDLPRSFMGDPLRLGQVLLNLLSNAVKFTERGEVSIEASLEKDKLRFAVVDTGIGMTSAQVDQLFNPFQQADASSTRRFGGTGLGLAISKRIVDLMHGSITISSQQDKGTTVEFLLPYLAVANATSDTVDDAPGGVDEVDAPLAGYSILLAEDEPDNQSILVESLSDMGAKVVAVSNGQEAVDRIVNDGAAAYDLLLMDIQMPVMDGYQATHRILQLAPGLPIIAQTAHAFSEERERCFAAGMIGHLSKPINADELVRLVRGKIPAKIV
ncbi:MAG: sensory box protein [Proteobacteria bacterium]|nr:sensory box protein [Pseudomonadota bacterium]